jgi:hypothetical protein
MAPGEETYYAPDTPYVQDMEAFQALLPDASPEVLSVIMQDMAMERQADAFDQGRANLANALDRQIASGTFAEADPEVQELMQFWRDTVLETQDPQELDQLEQQFQNVLVQEGQKQRMAEVTQQRIADVDAIQTAARAGDMIGARAAVAKSLARFQDLDPETWMEVTAAIQYPGIMPRIDYWLKRAEMDPTITKEQAMAEYDSMAGGAGVGLGGHGLSGTWNALTPEARSEIVDVMTTQLASDNPDRSAVDAVLAKHKIPESALPAELLMGLDEQVEDRRTMAPFAERGGKIQSELEAAQEASAAAITRKEEAKAERELKKAQTKAEAYAKGAETLAGFDAKLVEIGYDGNPVSAGPASFARAILWLKDRDTTVAGSKELLAEIRRYVESTEPEDKEVLRSLFREAQPIRGDAPRRSAGSILRQMRGPDTFEAFGGREKFNERYAKESAGGR